MESIIPLGLVAVGLLSLFLGRRLFWLFVALGGFLLGLALGQLVGKDWGAPGQLLAGLALGAIAAVLSIYLQKPMAALAAFFIGGSFVSLITLALRYGTNSLPLLLFNQVGEEVGLIFLVAGIVCAVLAWLIFEKTLIVLSALIGALLVMSGLASFLPSGAPPFTAPLLTIGLAALGIWVQARRT